MRPWYRLCRFLISVGYHLSWWPKMEGREHLPDGPFLICANHRSFFDPPLLGVKINWREVGYLAKEELFANPVSKWIMWSWSVRPIRRGTIDRAATQHVRDLLDRNVPVLVFPEGTRSRTGKMQQPRPGVGRLARLAGVPVVPAYIFGTFGITPFRWGRMRVRFGTPITPDEVSAIPDTKDGYRALSRLIMERLCDISDDPARDRADAFAHERTTAQHD